MEKRTVILAKQKAITRLGTIRRRKKKKTSGNGEGRKEHIVEGKQR